MKTLEQAKSLVDQTYERILDALCEGSLKAGERVTQEDVAARLNVSRQPVTHALTMLKTQGFLVQAGRRGLIVSAVRPDFFDAIYQLRSAVDPLAAKLATPRMTARLVMEGKAVVARGRAMVEVGDSHAVLQADADFHRFIYEACGNDLVAATMRLHWLHFRRAMREVLRFPGMSAAVWHEHDDILQAMATGEAQAAEHLMHRHVVDAHHRVSASPEQNSPQ